MGFFVQGSVGVADPTPQLGIAAPARQSLASVAGQKAITRQGIRRFYLHQTPRADVAPFVRFGPGHGEESWSPPRFLHGGVTGSQPHMIRPRRVRVTRTQPRANEPAIPPATTRRALTSSGTPNERRSKAATISGSPWNMKAA